MNGKRTLLGRLFREFPNACVFLSFEAGAKRLGEAKVHVEYSSRAARRRDRAQIDRFFRLPLGNEIERKLAEILFLFLLLRRREHERMKSYYQ